MLPAPEKQKTRLNPRAEHPHLPDTIEAWEEAQEIAEPEYLKAYGAAPVYPRPQAEPENPNLPF